MALEIASFEDFGVVFRQDQPGEIGAKISGAMALAEEKGGGPDASEILPPPGEPGFDIVGSAFCSQTGKGFSPTGTGVFAAFVVPDADPGEHGQDLVVQGNEPLVRAWGKSEIFRGAFARIRGRLFGRWRRRIFWAFEKRQRGGSRRCRRTPVRVFFFRRKRRGSQRRGSQGDFT